MDNKPDQCRHFNQPNFMLNSVPKEAQVSEHVDTFLRGEGNNIPLADGLQKQKRYWIGPVNFPLDRLVRSCGPEESMEYKESEEGWNSRLNSLVKHIEGGGRFFPLIATYTDGLFSVRDGNHRYGALKKLGIKSHPTYIWSDTEELYRKAQNETAVIISRQGEK